MLSQGELQQLIFINTLGMTSLVQALTEASYMFAGSNHTWCTRAQTGITQKAARQSFLFIQGTGLEMMLEQYCIDLNPEELRNGFYSLIGQRKFIE